MIAVAGPLRASAQHGASPLRRTATIAAWAECEGRSRHGSASMALNSLLAISRTALAARAGTSTARVMTLGANKKNEDGRIECHPCGAGQKAPAPPAAPEALSVLAAMFKRETPRPFHAGGPGPRSLPAVPALD